MKRPINSGSASAPRNDGILAAKGKYIFFLDSDDYIYSYTLIEMLNSIKKNDADLVYIKYDGDKGRSWGKRPFIKGDVLGASISGNHLVRSLMSSKLIRSDIIKDNKIFYPMNIKVGEDRLFMMQVLIACKKINILGSKPYYYITNHDQVRLTHSGSDFSSDYRIVSGVFNEIILSNLNLESKSEILSSWLNVFIESYLVLRLVSKSVTLEEKKSYFSKLFFDFERFKNIVDTSLIYEDLREIYFSFLQNNLELVIELSLQNREKSKLKK